MRTLCLRNMILHYRAFGCWCVRTCLLYLQGCRGLRRPLIFWRWRGYFHLQCLELILVWCSFICQKNGVSNHTAVETPRHAVVFTETDRAESAAQNRIVAEADLPAMWSYLCSPKLAREGRSNGIKMSDQEVWNPKHWGSALCSVW